MQPPPAPHLPNITADAEALIPSGGGGGGGAVAATLSALLVAAGLGAAGVVLYRRRQREKRLRAWSAFDGPLGVGVGGPLGVGATPALAPLPPLILTNGSSGCGAVEWSSSQPTDPGGGLAPLTSPVNLLPPLFADLRGGQSDPSPGRANPGAAASGVDPVATPPTTRNTAALQRARKSFSGGRAKSKSKVGTSAAIGRMSEPLMDGTAMVDASSMQSAL